VGVPESCCGVCDSSQGTKHDEGEAKKLAETLYAWNQELLRRSSMEWESVSTTAVHQMWQDGSLDAR